ncbi:MAG: hypothetical protein KJP19_07005, partial [Deltaproteobacteria bacterium]|nr:hypothetical protein [Deltaproteobacteria bacterium]
SGLSARDVIVYVNGSTQAVVFGQGTRIRANILAMNGSLTTGEGCILEGSFIAKDVTIGQKSRVTYDGAFSQGDEEEPPTESITLTATTRKAGANCYVDLVWEGSTASAVDIYRDGDYRTTTPNDGAYTDWGKKLKGPYTYIACNQGTSICSNEVTVEF